MIDLVLAVVLAAVNLGVAFYVLKNANRMFKNKPEWLETFVEESKEGLLDSANEFFDGKVGQFLQPDEHGNNFIDLVAARFGKGFRMSLLAQKSGQARHEKMIENRVFNAMKENSPELQLGLKVLDSFGLGDLATPENMPVLLKLANKYGLTKSFLGQNIQNPANDGALRSA